MIFLVPRRDLPLWFMKAPPDRSLPQRVWEATGGLVRPAAEFVRVAGLMAIWSDKAYRQADRRPPAVEPTPTGIDE